MFIIHQIFTKETFKRRKVNLFSHGSHKTVAIGDNGWKKKYFRIHGGYGRASYDKRTQITIRQVMEYGIRRCIDKYPFIPIRERKIKFRRNDKLPFCHNRSLNTLRGNLDLMGDTAILFGNNQMALPLAFFRWITLIANQMITIIIKYIIIITGIRELKTPFIVSQ